MKTLFLISILLSIIFLSGCVNQNKTEVTTTTTIPEEEYSPQINPNDFVTEVDNKYFSLTPGTNFIYEGETEEGTERTETYVTDQTKEILGIQTVVVWDRVWLNGELIEDTKDWYVQDKEGNVWYFGEDSKELVDGKVVSTAGSWESGVDGAKPGIIMKANPKVGDSYRQEYYKGEAEDMTDVLSIAETVTVPYGNFTNCLKTRDWTPLELDADEHKYYCPEVGFVTLEVIIENGEKVELINITTENKTVEEVEAEQLKTNITEGEAKEIALEEVPGRVTDITIEKKFGKIAYVVEIDADEGPETDVIIDIETGEILGIER